MVRIIFSKKGQSLVEVIVACGVLAIVMSAMMSIAFGARNLVNRSEDQTKATALAQEAIEIARHQRDVGCSFNDIKNSDGSLKGTNFIIEGDKPTGAETEKLILGNISETTDIDEFPDFRRYIEIKELSDTEFTNLGMDACGTGANDSCFEVTDCNSQNNFDCRTKYYMLKAVVQNETGTTLSEIQTILTK